MALAKLYSATGKHGLAASSSKRAVEIMKAALGPESEGGAAYEEARAKILAIPPCLRVSVVDVPLSVPPWWNPALWR